MRILRSICLLALAGLLLSPSGADRAQAARDLKTTSATVHMELLVLEVRGCNICSLVRTRLQPAYEQTSRAREIPMRYVDVTSMDETKLGLNGPIDTVPTIVLMREGREVERIAGYIGPENFLTVLTHLMRQLDE